MSNMTRVDETDRETNVTWTSDDKRAHISHEPWSVQADQHDVIAEATDYGLRLTLAADHADMDVMLDASHARRLARWILDHTEEEL